MAEICLALWTDGAVTDHADFQQCQKERWFPIAVVRQNGVVLVPFFTDPKVARNFCKRNYPKEWTDGFVAVTVAELEWMEAKGWKFIKMNYARLFKDIPGFGYEILELQNEPDLYMGRKKDDAN